MTRYRTTLFVTTAVLFGAMAMTGCGYTGSHRSDPGTEGPQAGVNAATEQPARADWHGDESPAHTEASDPDGGDDTGDRDLGEGADGEQLGK